jgi:hypothetical protein
MHEYRPEQTPMRRFVADLPEKAGKLKVSMAASPTDLRNMQRPVLHALLVVVGMVRPGHKGLRHGTIKQVGMDEEVTV